MIFPGSSGRRSANTGPGCAGGRRSCRRLDCDLIRGNLKRNESYEEPGGRPSADRLRWTSRWQHTLRCFQMEPKTNWEVSMRVPGLRLMLCHFALRYRACAEGAPTGTVASHFGVNGNHKRRNQLSVLRPRLVMRDRILSASGDNDISIQTLTELIHYTSPGRSSRKV